MPTYNWSDYFDHRTVKTALKGIKSNHHFRFTHSSPGVVLVKEASRDEEKEISMLKEPTWKVSCHNLPDLVTPLGLSLEWQWYLYDKIREFVANSKDLVCPKPLQPLP